MPSLHELQERFAAAVRGGDPSPVTAAIVDDAPGATSRIAIYANHFRVTLIDTLAATFPVVLRLVGDAFFRATARHFIGAAPPAQPCLFEYGERFPDFLAQLPEAASLPYLADVARLEWAINEAATAADAADAAFGPRGQEDGLRVALHPSCRLVTSPNPVDRIWQVHQRPCSEIDAVDLGAGAVCLLVHRQEGDVGWICLAPSDAAFVDALRAGRTLSEAFAAAQPIDDGFDPTPLLAALIEAGLLSLPTPIPQPGEEP